VTYNVPYRKLLTGRTKQEDIEEDPYVPVLALSNVSAINTPEVTLATP
jgi:hypothetical protein